PPLRRAPKSTSLLDSTPRARVTISTRPAPRSLSKETRHMTRRVRPVVHLALALSAAVVATAHLALAAVYPANACVSTKQEGAGRFCKGVLKAWAGFEAGGDAGRRDAALQRAAAKLEADWSAAETNALANGTDCAETTLAVTAAEAL